MLITEISKNNLYWHGSDNRAKESPYLNQALEWAHYWDKMTDYFFDNEDRLGPDWLFDEEKKIHNNLSNIGFEFYLGPKGMGVIDLSRNLLYLINSYPYKPVDGIRSSF